MVAGAVWLESRRCLGRAPGGVFAKLANGRPLHTRHSA